MAATTNLAMSIIDPSEYVDPRKINNNFGILDKLGKDYLTESGYSGEWWYRKYNSGRLECGIDNKSFGDLDHKANWGAVFSSNDKSFGAYPFQFSSRPATFISFNANDGTSHRSYVAVVGTNSTSMSPAFALIDPNSGTANNAQFGILAVGRYK